MPQTKTMSKFKTIDLVYIALGAVIMTVCSWITIPVFTIPYTLQTFAVFAVIGMLGGFRGTMSILVWISLGAVGVPVFSNFKGGIGALLGTTGGYIVGFIFSALFFWLVLSLFGNGSVSRKVSAILGMIGGLLICYAFGTAWFVIVYTQANGPITVLTALGWCVFPYIIPDLIKLALAYVVTLAVNGRLRIAKY